MQNGIKFILLPRNIQTTIKIILNIKQYHNQSSNLKILGKNCSIKPHVNKSFRSLTEFFSHLNFPFSQNSGINKKLEDRQKTAASFVDLQSQKR